MSEFKFTGFKHPLRTSRRLLASCFAALLFTGCGPARDDTPIEQPSDELPLVLAANFPLAFFATELAGERAIVEYPGPLDEDPAFWQPDHDTLRRFQSADLILLNGPGYSAWVSTVALALNQTLDTTAEFGARLIETEAAFTHSHGPSGAGSAAHLDLTTWLDPSLATLQAASIRDALTRLDPAGQADFERRFQLLADRLAEIDRRLRKSSALDPGRPILASHPVYAYLANRFELNLRSVHFEPDRPPTPAEWLELDDILTTFPAKRMIWEARPQPETVAGLQQRGLTCFVVAPGASGSDGPDLLQIMSENAAHLKEALSGPR